MQETENIAKKEQEISRIFSLLKCLFEGKNPPEIHWDQLPSDGQLRTMIYSCFRETLSAELKAEAQASYYKFTIAEMRRKTSLDALQKILKESGIRAWLLKGSELAYRYYPDPALRYSVDIDILTAEKDAVPLFQKIAENGWTPEHEVLDFHGKHLPELRRKNFCTIEIHKHLFQGNPDENQELIQLLQEDPESPELLLAHLMYHAFYHHHWHNALKTVIDVGMVLRKGTADPEKYRKISQKFHLKGLLESVLASFPECYPQHWREQFPAPHLTSEIKESIRKIALYPELFSAQCPPEDLVFLAKQSLHSERKIVLDKLLHLSPAILSIVYRIPLKKAWILYPFLLPHYLISRGLRYSKMRRKQTAAGHDDLAEVYRNIGKILSGK